MTKSNTLPFNFQAPKGRKFDLSFSGGHITSDGGLLLLSKLDEKLGITSDVAKILSRFDPVKRGKYNILLLAC